MEEKRIATRKTWEEFTETGFPWAINRILLLSGWCLERDRDAQGQLLDGCHPVRIDPRDFGWEKEKNFLKQALKSLGLNAQFQFEQAEYPPQEDDDARFREIENLFSHFCDAITVSSSEKA